MALSLNTSVDLSTSGVFYRGLDNKVGNFLIGDKAIEFYKKDNPEDFIKIPWSTITQIGANVHGRKVSRHFQVFTEEGKFLFASSESGKILKIAREKIGNENVIQLPTLLQKISRAITSRFKR